MSDISKKIETAKRLLLEVRGELAKELKGERGRRRGEINRLRHEMAVMTGHDRFYFSQAGQDLVVDRLLRSKRNGFFVDIGGYDGVSGSNSLFFEMFRRWSGLLIEPAPTQLRRAQEVRNVPCLGYALSGQPGEAEFLEVTSGYTQMSGFVESYDANLLAKVRANPAHEEVIHKLEKKTLNAVLDEFQVAEVDFLSLDVEGGEMSILESFDFSAVNVNIWSIENNLQQSDLPNFMASKGYSLVEFAGVDDIFMKKTD